MKELRQKPCYYSKAIAYRYIFLETNDKEPTLSEISKGIGITYDQARTAIRWFENQRQKYQTNMLAVQEPLLEYDNDIAKEVIQYLNQKSGRQFQNVKTHRELIRYRIKEGYKKEDFFLVIDHRAEMWGEDFKMSEYLRPSTLFTARHFSEYVPAARHAHEQGIINIPATAEMQDIVDNINDQLESTYSLDYSIRLRLHTWLRKGWTKNQLIEVANTLIFNWLNTGNESKLDPKNIYGKKFQEYAQHQKNQRKIKKASQKHQFDRNLAAFVSGSSAYGRSPVV